MGRGAVPLLIYDGGCTFCRAWIEGWRDATGDRVEYATSEQASPLFPEIAPERFAAAVVLVDCDGAVYDGAEAVARVLDLMPRRRWLVWLYRHMPGARLAAEFGYRVVAARRATFSRLTTTMWGDDLRPPRYYLVRWVFLRGLGGVYFCAFASLWLQLDGLIGSRGILPMRPWLEAVAARHGAWAGLRAPTLLWLAPSDWALNVAGATGVVLSVMLIIGTAPRAVSALLWLVYLSLFTVGRDFLSFQWDILLLETGFVAILFAPPGLRPRLHDETAVARTPLWLLRWLLFRLMFLSGVIKATSGDDSWWNLTALSFHYETQPLPAWTSWYAHNLPMWFHRVSVASMFVIELVVPVLIFAPRRLRLGALIAFVTLQFAIMATGNYGYFNILTCLLCVVLLDDSYLAALLPPRWRGLRSRRRTVESQQPRLRGYVVTVVAVALVAMSLAQAYGRVYGYKSIPTPVRTLLAWTGPFHFTNAYGLFAVMTKSRPEIIIEGSNDGKTWQSYGFRWKPGDPSVRPRFVAPHQPRLDWQMWFAALGDYRRNPWVVSLMYRLLEGSAPVLGLLGANPFPQVPPRYIRAMLYDYRFTTGPIRRAEGLWWKREVMRPYTPVLSLSSATQSN